jgi:hypothetical protein
MSLVNPKHVVVYTKGGDWNVQPQEVRQSGQAAAAANSSQPRRVVGHVEHAWIDGSRVYAKIKLIDDGAIYLADITPGDQRVTIEFSAAVLVNFAHNAVGKRVTSILTTGELSALTIN